MKKNTVKKTIDRKKIKSLLLKGAIGGSIVFLVSVVLSLLVGEYIVKHIFPQQTYNLAKLEGLHIFEESPTLPFTVQKNLTNVHHLGYTHEFTHNVTTNSHGTRGEEFGIPKPPKPTGYFSWEIL